MIDVGDEPEFLTSCFVSMVDVVKYPNALDTKQEVRKKYSCYICFQKFCTNEDLDQHKTQHGNDGDTDEDNERIEKNNVHDFEELIAEDSQEPNESNFNSLNLDNAEVNFGCLACNVTFQSQSDIKAHFHNTSKCKYLCKICKRYFSMKGGFMVHILKHAPVSEARPSSSQEIGELPYKCKQCDDSFEDRSDLMRHHVTAHSIAHDPIECDSPDVPMNNCRRNPHNPITGTIPIFDCGICYDVFASEAALVRHEKMHTQSAIPKVEPSAAPGDAADLISDFTPTPTPPKTKAPHPRKAPLRTIAPQDCIDNRESPPLHFVKKPSKPVEKITRTSSAKKLVSVDSTLNPEAANQGFQFMNVANPGLTTSPASLPQTGQSYILINPNNYPVGAVNSSLSGMNPIPHLVPRAPATASCVNSVANPNILVNSDGKHVSQATFINSLNEFSTIEPGKPLYFLVPANQQVAETQKSAVATGAAGESSCSWIPKLVPVTDTRSNRYRPRQRLSKNPANMGMPFLNVESTIQISDDDNANSLQENSDIIMPIITSFGTVPDDSGHKKPKTTEPATKYEGEFQKFLKDGLNKNKVVCVGPAPRPKISLPKVEPSEIATASQTGDPLAHVDVSRKSLSEVKEPDNPEVVPISPALDPLSCDQPSSSGNNDPVKPKIFVKKLTDLIDAPKEPGKRFHPMITDLFCGLCKKYFNRWLKFKNHMEQRHDMFGCKFFKCGIFDDGAELMDHMKSHRCQYCKGEYRKLSSHAGVCHVHPNSSVDIHESEELIVTYDVD